MVTGQRQCRRFLLNLPVRLCWPGPLIPVLEVTQTLDVSSRGLLLYSTTPCRLKALLSVTFPFHPEAAPMQPQTLARVAHLQPAAERGYLLGLGFESVRHGVPAAIAQDRRTCERFRLVFPVRVRKASVRWPEQTLTTDVSRFGVQFCTSRFFAPGDPVRVALPFLHPQWESAEELDGRVVRVGRLWGSVFELVAVALT